MSCEHRFSTVEAIQDAGLTARDALIMGAALETIAGVVDRAMQDTAKPNPPIPESEPPR